MSLFYDILEAPRQRLLPSLAFLKADNFYLAGGTGLALYLGHRQSIDFDFFRERSFDTERLLAKFSQHFAAHSVAVVQQAENTLTATIDDHAKVSLFAYPYPLLQPWTEEPFPQIQKALRAAVRDYSQRITAH
jgi:hypothetical protein